MNTEPEYIAEVDACIAMQKTKSHLFIHSYSDHSKHPILFRHYSHSNNKNSEISNGIMVKRNYCVLFLPREVSFYFVTDDNIYVPHFGDAVLFVNDETSCTFFKNSTNTDYYEFDFPLEFFEDKSKNMFRELFYGGEGQRQNMITIDTRSINHILQKIDNIEHHIKTNPQNADIIGWSYIVQIFWKILSCRQKNSISIDTNATPPILRKAMDYISANYTTIDSIDEVASHCYISKSYLCRIFKKHLMISPGEFILNFKISHAKYLLSTNHSVTDACFKSGFKTYTYFISAFKKNTGITPHKFQKEQH